MEGDSIDLMAKDRGGWVAGTLTLADRATLSAEAGLSSKKARALKLGASDGPGGIDENGEGVAAARVGGMGEARLRLGFSGGTGRPTRERLGVVPLDLMMKVGKVNGAESTSSFPS